MAARKSEIERMVSLLNNWRRELEPSKDENVRALGESLSDAYHQLNQVVEHWPDEYGYVISVHSKPIEVKK